MESLPARPEDSQPRLQRIPRADPPRLARIRALSQLMDQSITLPSGFRIGLDPLLGLLPGIGDLIGASVSLWFVYEAARLGIRKRVLFRMLGNVLAEVLVGTVPILGDVFDAVWKANMRNVRLIDLHYYPALRERSPGRVLGTIGIVLGMVLLGFAAVIVWVMAGLLALLEKLIG